MKSTLEELYYDSEELVERIGTSEEYNKINDEFCEVFEKLLETLNDEQKEMLNNLCNLSGGLESAMAVTRFKAGFKLCMRLIFDGISK